MSREQFLVYYEREKLPLSETAKENHWKTWQAAWDALLSAHGPVVMLTLDNVEMMPDVETKT